MTLRRFAFGIFRILIGLFVLATPVWAEAHPGLHFNPHVPPMVLVLLLAFGFMLLAGLSMLAYLKFRIYRAEADLKRAKDNMIRARLGLAQAQEERAYWSRQLTKALLEKKMALITAFLRQTRN